MAGDFVDSVARLLNDLNDNGAKSYVGWTKEELECYYQEALKLIRSLRPDLATECVDFKLNSGSFQKVPAECGQLVSVVGVVNEAGNVDEVLSEGETQLAKWFKKCRVSEGISSYQKDANSPFSFTVNPPVETDDCVTIRVQCLSKGNTENLENDDCRFEPAIREWMLYRAYSVEMDSATSMNSANVHLQAFFTLMQLSYQVQQQFLLGGFNNVVNN